MIVKEIFDKAIEELRIQQGKREFESIEVKICTDKEKDLGLVIMLYDFMCDGCKGVDGCNHQKDEECEGGYCANCMHKDTCKTKNRIEKYYEGKCIWQRKTLETNAFIVCFEVLVIKNFSKSANPDNILAEYHSENFDYSTEEYTELYDLLEKIIKYLNNE